MTLETIPLGDDDLQRQLDAYKCLCPKSGELTIDRTVRVQNVRTPGAHYGEMISRATGRAEVTAWTERDGAPHARGRFTCSDVWFLVGGEERRVHMTGYTAPAELMNAVEAAAVAEVLQDMQSQLDLFA